MGASLFRNVDLFLTDPPYNVWSKAEKAKSAHDVVTQEKITDLVKLCSEVMALGANESIFCSWLQFDRWYQTLHGRVEECQAISP